MVLSLFTFLHHDMLVLESIDQFGHSCLWFFGVLTMFGPLVLLHYFSAIYVISFLESLGRFEADPFDESRLQALALATNDEGKGKDEADGTRDKTGQETPNTASASLFAQDNADEAHAKRQKPWEVAKSMWEGAVRSGAQAKQEVLQLQSAKAFLMVLSHLKTCAGVVVVYPHSLDKIPPSELLERVVPGTCRRSWRAGSTRQTPCSSSISPPTAS
jgi:hypothetical protein